MPERFTSVKVARALAAQARSRAQMLVTDKRPVFGMGLTATIATDRKKRGDHRVALAVQDSLGSLSYELTLTKGERSRIEEETLVSTLTVSAVAEACGVFALPELALLPGEQIGKVFEPVAALAQLSNGERDWLTVLPSGELLEGPLNDVTFLSGSFNPLHAGHRKLAEVAGQMTAETVYFELPFINADKAPIDLIEARQRAVQFLGYAPLVLSRASLFSDKAALFPRATFVLGADTAARLVNVRFYGGETHALDASLERVRAEGGSFLVAGRSSKDDFKTLDDIPVPAAHLDLFREIPKAAFNMDISSSEIRARSGKT